LTEIGPGASGQSITFDIVGLLFLPTNLRQVPPPRIVKNPLNFFVRPPCMQASPPPHPFVFSMVDLPCGVFRSFFLFAVRESPSPPLFQEILSIVTVSTKTRPGAGSALLASLQLPVFALSPWTGFPLWGLRDQLLSPSSFHPSFHPGPTLLSPQALLPFQIEPLFLGPARPFPIRPYFRPKPLPTLHGADSFP